MKMKTHRKQLGLSQPEYAPIVGMSQAHVCRMEKEFYTASLGQALEVEQRTGGAVMAEDLPLTDRSRKALKRLRAQMKALKAS